MILQDFCEKSFFDGQKAFFALFFQRYKHFYYNMQLLCVRITWGYSWLQYIWTRESFTKVIFLHVEEILYIFIFSSLFTGLHSKGLFLNKNTPLLLMVCWSVSSCFLHFSPSHRQSRTSAQEINE